MMTAKEINATAADWAARIDRGPLTAEEERALALWMDSDARKRGAFMRMRAIALHTERAQALGPAFDPHRFVNSESPPRTPSTTLQLALKSKLRLLVAAAAAFAVMVISWQFVVEKPVYATRKGELRVVSLDDGSVITLNTSSRVEVDFKKEIREVRLIEGEALFDVAKDKSRPFIVAAGNASVRALGTSFTVRRLVHKPLLIVVREGVVEVQQPTLAAPLKVTANMRAEVPLDPRRTAVKPVAIRPDAVDRELAWRDGRIAFEAERLDQAAAAFARYSEPHIIVDDPAVARKEITGLFTANDPISFAKAAATSLGLKAEVRAGQIHLHQ